jgi:hypothetical protein
MRYSDVRQQTLMNSVFTQLNSVVRTRPLAVLQHFTCGSKIAYHISKPHIKTGTGVLSPNGPMCIVPQTLLPSAAQTRKRRVKSPSR